ncbi:hypothetical protein PO909_010819 [Leuciscus waleckii]
MDESALLDLLECPVCLERLDTTAKVLPCQHTFCRRCLLGIVGSRGELRCPECRTLVESGVDELPSNILLVRLLDGIKQRPRRTGSMHGTCTNGSAAAGVRAQGAGAGQRDPGPTGAQSQRVQAKSTPVRETVRQHNDGLTSSLSPPVLRRRDSAFCGQRQSVCLCSPRCVFLAVLGVLRKEQGMLFIASWHVYK